LLHFRSSLLAGAALFALAQTSFAQTWNDPPEHVGEPVAPEVCYAEGTPDHYMLAIEQALLRKYGPDKAKYSLANRWTGGQGSNIALTWSLVPDGLFIPSGVGEPNANSSLFARMNQLHANNQALWISKIQACFDRWEALCGIDFTRVTAAGVDWDDGAGWGTAGNDTTRGDIRISAHPIDGGFGVLAYASYPNNGDIVLDSQENWGSGQPSSIFMRNIIMHELGHSIGIAHVCPINGSKLMEPSLSTGFDGPRHDDIRAAQRHYGDDNELDDSSATAFDVGTLTGTSVSFGAVPAPAVSNSSILSLDNNGEQDWWKFTIGGAANLSVTLTPVGLSYSSGAQTGGCTGSTFNSLAHANLGFEVRSGATGATILTTVNAQASGIAETLTNFNLATAGTYFVRVFESDAPTQSQLYTINFDADPTCAGSVAQGGAGCAGGGGCTPAINLTGCPQSNQNVTFSVANAVGGQVAVLLMGLSSASIPASNGCILRVGASLPITVTLPLSGVGNCNGNISVPTLLPVLSPGTLHFQAVCGDPSKGGGFTLSNSIAVTFAP
jgi:Matrixin